MEAPGVSALWVTVLVLVLGDLVAAAAAPPGPLKYSDRLIASN